MSELLAGGDIEDFRGPFVASSSETSYKGSTEYSEFKKGS